MAVNVNPNTNPYGGDGEITELGRTEYIWTEINHVDLTNYYSKTETNTQINNATNPLANRISALETGAVTIDTSHDSLEALINTLGNIGLASNKIYIVPSENEEEDNIYDEYIVKEGELERIGSKELTLTDYLKIEDLGSETYDICTLDCTTTHAGVNGATKDAINIKINFAD